MLKSFMLLLTFILLNSCTGKKDKEIFVQSGNNRIAITDCGNADTTLLFVHGWGINQSYWINQVDYFCHRYRVVTLDLPGFGASDKTLDTGWHFGQYTNDVKRVIMERGVKNVVLIGHSMSGDMILDMDSKHPSLLAGIVGVDNLQEPAPLLTDTARSEMDSFFRMMSSHFDSIVNAYMPQQLFQPATDSITIKRVMQDILANDPVLATRVLRENAFFTDRQRKAMKSLSHPLLLVNSDAYPVNDSLLRQFCAKGYRLATIPGSGHYPMIEQPERFNRLLQQLLDGLGPK